MTLHLNSQADLEEAIRALLKQDPRLQPVFEVAGMPALRRREPGFQGLAHIVCGQQLSTASAAAIWGRLTAAFDPFDHDSLRRARADRLGRLGLSAAKIKTLKNLAREIAAERVNLDVLANEDADAAHHTLVSLHGIGPWTADVYLLFCLGHGDAWPAGDLAVQEAVKIGLGLKTRPTAKEMAPLAEPWRPMRGAAAHLWWSYYRAIKKREGVIAGTDKRRCFKKYPGCKTLIARQLSARSQWYSSPEWARRNHGRARGHRMLDRTEDISIAAESWLAEFERALEHPDSHTLRPLFHPDSFWRDVLALSWNLQTLNGADAILNELPVLAGRTAPSGFKIDVERAPPRRVKRAGTDTIEAIFKFETIQGRGHGIIRLIPDAR